MNNSQKCYVFISIKLIKNVCGNQANSKIMLLRITWWVCTHHSYDAHMESWYVYYTRDCAQPTIIKQSSLHYLFYFYFTSNINFQSKSVFYLSSIIKCKYRHSIMFFDTSWNIIAVYVHKLVLCPETVTGDNVNVPSSHRPIHRNQPGGSNCDNKNTLCNICHLQSSLLPSWQVCHLYFISMFLNKVVSLFVYK